MTGNDVDIETVSDAPQVSVIVPIYNVEAYLQDCLESLRTQTISRFEVICVDDGSTDNSASIAQTFVDQDARFALIRQPNAGLSAARNAGVQLARGRYLQFLDSDDYLVPHALEALTTTAVRDELDVLFYDGESFFETVDLSGRHSGYESYYTRSANHSSPMAGPDLFAQMLNTDDYRPSACLQFISRRHFEEQQLSFREGIIHEDNLFTFQSLLTAARAAHTPQALYMRRVREGSITTRTNATAEFTAAMVTLVDMRRFLDGRQWPESVRPAIADYVNRTMSRAVRYACELSDDEFASFGQADEDLDVQIARGAVAMQRREVLRRRMAESTTRARIRRRLSAEFK